MSKRRSKRQRFSEQFRAAIADCGLTRYRIAELTGVSQSALSLFANGHRGLSQAAQDAVAELLDLEIVRHGPKQS